MSVATTGGLTLRLRSGLELRLGDTTDVPLKLAVARRILHLLPPGSGYVDISVPIGPSPACTALDSQVEVETSASTGT